MTTKEVLSILDKIELKQEAWGGGEHIMTFNGDPFGATISRKSMEIDRWWDGLKKEIAFHIMANSEQENG